MDLQKKKNIDYKKKNEQINKRKIITDRKKKKGERKNRNKEKQKYRKRKKNRNIEKERKIEIQIDRHLDRYIEESWLEYRSVSGNGSDRFILQTNFFYLSQYRKQKQK